MADREGVQFFGPQWPSPSLFLSSRSGEARRGTPQNTGRVLAGRKHRLQMGRSFAVYAAQDDKASRATTEGTPRWLIRFLTNCAIRSATLSNGWLTPVSCSIEVMVTFAIPQGVMA